MEGIFMAYSGNLLNTYNNKSRRALGYFYDFVVPSNTIKEAQFIVSICDDSKNKDDWQQLAQELLKTAIKTNYEGGNFVTNTCMTIIEWDRSFKKDSSAKLRGNKVMNSMNVWQNKLTELLFAKEQTDKVVFFKQFGIDHVYVIVNDPSTEVIFDYSKLYCDFILSQQDLIFEFLVFGSNEFRESDIEGSIVINRGDYDANS